MLNQGNRVLIAVSGGCDSVALGELFFRLKFRWNLRLAVIHFDHQARKESYLDRDLVQKLADRWEADFHFFQYCPQAGSSSSFQNQARHWRYGLMVDIAFKVKAHRIATAHHQDDAAETVLIRLLTRGGSGGLSGVPPIRPVTAQETPSEQRHLSNAPQKKPLLPTFIRPFYGCTKKEIKEFLVQSGLSFNEDSSNQENYYLRNRVRNQLLPRLEKDYNPKLKQHLAQMADINRMTENFFEDLIFRVMGDNNIVEQTKDQISINLPQLACFLAGSFPHPAVISRLIMAAIRTIDPFQPQEICFSHIQAVLDCLNKNQGSKYHKLPGKIWIRSGYHKLVLSKKPFLTKEPDLKTVDLKNSRPPSNSVEPFIVNPALKETGTFKVPQFSIELQIRKIAPEELPYTPSDREQIFTKREITFPLQIRNFLPGDRIAIKGGHKKVKKVLMEKKIPRDQRSSIPMLLNNQGQILWILGLRRCYDPTFSNRKECYCLSWKPTPEDDGLFFPPSGVRPVKT